MKKSGPAGENALRVRQTLRVVLHSCEWGTSLVLVPRCVGDAMELLPLRRPKTLPGAVSPVGPCHTIALINERAARTGPHANLRRVYVHLAKNLTNEILTKDAIPDRSGIRGAPA